MGVYVLAQDWRLTESECMSKRILIAGVVIGICAVLFSRWHENLLAGLGGFLVVEQRPTKSDVIVILNGRDTERAVAAVDLYNRGMSTQIAVPRGVKQAGTDEFRRRARGVMGGKSFLQRAVEAMGVPAEAFEVIGGGAGSTYEEAKATYEYAKEREYRSVVIVTSKWHSRRAYKTFASVLGEDPHMRVTICPAEYDTYDAKNWWKHEDQVELVVREYSRLLYYLVVGRIRLGSPVPLESGSE